MNAVPEPHEPLATAEDLVGACQRGAATLVRGCAELRPGERAYVLADPATRVVADYVAAACRELTPEVRLDVIDAPAVHGAAPPPHVAPAMARADVVFCLTSTSLAHTEERHRACRQGTRFLSLPDYDLPLLAGPSLQFDFAAVVPVAREVKERLDGAGVIHLRTAAGSDLRCSAAGRSANCCPGLCREPGTLGSPPDAEANVAPLEDSAEGVVCVDGSIPCREIGRLTAPVVLEVRRGAVARIGGDARAVAALEELFARVGAPEARVLAEFGVGLNSRADITGRMLEDEGCAGTIHLGFGSNATIGGANRVPFHLDFVVRAPTVEVDGRPLLRLGKLVPRRHAA